MRIVNHAQRICALLMAATFAGNVSAQPFIYPGKGQSANQQKKDEGECHVWAVQQSKYDPTKPPPQTAAAKPPTTATGTTPGAGVRGAARGAVVGGIAGDAGAGAAAGAVAARAKAGARTPPRHNSSSKRRRNNSRRGWARIRMRAQPASKGVATRSSSSTRSGSKTAQGTTPRS